MESIRLLETVGAMIHTLRAEGALKLSDFGERNHARRALYRLYKAGAVHRGDSRDEWLATSRQLSPVCRRRVVTDLSPFALET